MSRRKRRILGGKSDTSSSTISMKHMTSILEKLKSQQTRQSTSKNYLSVWRQFNSFLIKLDVKPDAWEDRTQLFIANLIETKGLQSSTIRSYVSRYALEFPVPPADLIALSPGYRVPPDLATVPYAPWHTRFALMEAAMSDRMFETTLLAL